MSDAHRTGADRRELRVVPIGVDKLLDELHELDRAGAGSVLLVGETALREEILAKATPRHIILREGAVPVGCRSSRYDAVFVLESSARRVSNALLQLADFDGRVVTVDTAHASGRRPVFLTSIPKSGTHLVSRVLESMGYSNGYSETLPGYDEELSFEPGHAYHISHATPDFFAVPRYRINGLIEAMSRSVLFFNYRDPRDIAVSLTHWIVRRTQFHLLNGYLRSLEPGERLLAVLTGRYPIPIAFGPHLTHRGDLRELVMRYAPWLSCPMPNQVSVRFEDLVGERGGGSSAAQLRTIWAMQLALHRAGRPSDFCDDVFSSSAKTYRSGQIASHQTEFDERHREAIASMPNDFLQLFGYEPGRVSSFHRAPDRFFGEIEIDGEPEQTAILNGYRGYNVFEYGGVLYGVAQSVGAFDIERASRSDIELALASGDLVQAGSIAAMKERIGRLAPVS